LHGNGVTGGIAPQIGHGQAGDHEPMAAGQFVAGRHHTGMLAIADQQFIAGLPRQAPERQHAGRGHVFAEGHPMGSHAKPLA
jgi:hypothetical protein